MVRIVRPDGGAIMIGRLNHVAIAVRDIERGGARLSRYAGGATCRSRCRCPSMA